LRARAQGDEEAVKRIGDATERLVRAQERQDRILSTKRAGTAAGQATLPGEASFQDALRRVQSRDSAISGLEGRARQATAAEVSPIDRLRTERAEFLSHFGQTEAGAKRINTAFNQMEEAERRAFDASRVQRFKEGFASFAVTVAASGGIIKELLFDTATYAAKTDTLRAASRQLATANNLSPAAVEKYTTLTRLKGITTQDALGTINQMIVSGLDVKKAPELAAVAQSQAQITGTADGHAVTSSEALSGIVHGIVTRQTDVLRTYGIALSFEDAFAKWKQANPGKELSETQKTAIGLQAVLDFGAKTAGVYGATMETVGKQMSSLPRFALEAKNAVGEQLQPALSEGVTVLTRLFMTIERNGSAFATLGTGLGTLVGALAVFKTGSFLAGLVGLEAIAGPIGWIAAGLTVLGGAYLFTTDKMSAQRDAIQLHIDQLKNQREALATAGLSQADYAKQLEQINKSSESARVALINLEVQQKRAGQSVNLQIPGFGTQSSIASGMVNFWGQKIGLLNPPHPFKVMGPAMPTNDNGATINPKLNEEEKAAKNAEALADRSRLAQDSLSAAKEGRQLKTQLADLDITAKMKEVRSRLEKGQLTNPSDIADALVLTRQHVDLETQQKIEDSRKRIDSKTGAERDISVSDPKEFAALVRREEANGNIRLQVETKETP
jgi:hypothetical protein